MISFEEAYKIAAAFKPDIDNCREYENGYVFGFSGDDNYVGGYNHTPVVILKENGKKETMPMFIINGTGKFIKSRKIKK